MRPPRKSAHDRQAAFLAKHPRLASRQVKLKSDEPSVRPIDLIALGVDDDKRVIRVADTPRLEHMHVIGATGCGKSTFLLNCILQDIARGRGVCVLDPHGGHPDSLMNMVLRFLHDHDWLATRKVHIIAPNVREHVVGFNPLAPLPDTDVSVIAGAMIKAFERAWGDENTLEKPTTRRLLRTIFTALIERGMTLPDAELLLDFEDAAGVRLNIIGALKSEQARRDLERIERLSKQPRSYEAFEQTVLGPLNRLAEFVSCDAIRNMLSMTREQETPDRTVDLLDIMNRGHILLVDLQHGASVDEAATDLLGKVLLRYLFLLMAHRKPYQLPGDESLKFHPFFIYVDECHRYVTDDIQGLLTESRKFGIGVTLAHQYLAQLGKPGEKVYEALRNSTELKAVFRVKSAKEAQELAHDVIPLDLEIPVQAGIRPVQVGFEIKDLASNSYSVHEGEGESDAVHAAQAISKGRTAMQHWMRSVGHASATSQGSGTATSSSFGTSEGLSAVQSHMDSMAYTYDPNTQTFVGMPMPLGMNVGSADGASNAWLSSNMSQRGDTTSQFESRSESESASEGEGGGLAFSEGVATSQGTSSARNKTRGQTQGRGSSQALFPVYADLPSGFHSKDNALYMAGETIRNLPVGRAILRFRDKITTLTVPPPRKPKSP
ncbi:MAG: hypothetical protein ACKVP4_05265 [Hyphomicrobium sp.]